VTIARAASTLPYPAGFMLVAAMNPCPCGYFSDSNHACACSAPQIHRYRSKISGPLLDRVDIHVEVPAVPYRDLTDRPGEESSSNIRERVTRARNIQNHRFRRSKIYCNAQMNSRQIKAFCAIEADCMRLLESAIEKLALSARAYHRILKIARTLADLAGGESIEKQHIAEAIQYRSMDRS
jgi:magnesium chelatase family protein